jgi:hypothetical protein
MAKGRKPIPKTQKEISISQENPYVPPVGAPGFSPMGSPNSDNSLNRAEQTSFKGDTVKPLSIGIQDIDESVMYYFQNVIKPFVIQNGERVVVPIIYGSPEKWKSFQKDGYYRDLNGKIMAPLIMFKKNNIEKVRNLTNKLDANSPNNIAVYGKRYSKQNEYSKFNILNNTTPEKTYYATVVPDYLNITYDCVIFTYYNDQLNKIIEALEYASDSYWGDPERFKFKATISSFTPTVELSDNQERVVRCALSITLYGYIIPDVPQKELNALKKFSNKNKLTFTLETVQGDKEQFNTTVNRAQTQGGGLSTIIDSPNIVNNTTIVSGTTQVILDYLNTNKAIQTSNVPTNSSAVFNGAFLTAPSGLPATSKDSFLYYINGQLIEPLALTSFIDNGNGTCTLTVNTTELGFTLDNTDEIIAIGKFV